MRAAVVLILAVAPLSGDEVWNEVRLDGKHIGWSHTVTTEEKEGDETVVRTVEEGTAWYGDKRFRWKTQYVETPDGKPRAFVYEGWEGDAPLPEIRGKPDGHGMKFAVLEGNKVTAVVHDEGFLFPLGERLLATSKGFAPGTKYSYRRFSVDDRRVVSVEAEVVGEAELALPEGPTKAHLVKHTQIGEEPILFEVHYDDAGNILSVNATDIQLVWIRSTRERATAISGPTK